MLDLFRFVLIRPPRPIKKGERHELTLSSAGAKRLSTTSSRARREAASKLLAQASAPADASIEAMQAVLSGTGNGATAAQIEQTASVAFGAPLQSALKSKTLATEVEQASENLILAKLASSSEGLDLEALATLVYGYDLLTRALASTSKQSYLSPLPLTFDATTLSAEAPASSGQGTAGTGAKAAASTRQTSAQSTAPAADEASTQAAAELRQATSMLAQIDSTSLEAKLQQSTSQTQPKARSRQAQTQSSRSKASKQQPTLLSGRSATSTLVLGKAAAQKLPASVQSQLRGLGIDPGSAPFLSVVDAVGRLAAQQASAAPQPAATRMARLGGRLYPFEPAQPSGAERQLGRGTLPETRIRSIGIGELLLVKERTMAYEGADVAYIENVLKSERSERRTRRLESTTETTTLSTETSKSEERDTQTTDRFTLQDQTSDTVKSEAQLKSGMAISASYGPMVQVKANVEVGASTSTSSSTNLATSFSKEVLSRSVSKLTEKVLQSRSVTTLSEFEERNRHGFDNTNGTGNISGVYQWVEKVSQAQVYSYGKRMLFDAIVPEPAAFYLYAAQAQQAHALPAVKPAELTITAADLDESNYLTYGAQYGAAELAPPPPPYIVTSKQWALPGAKGASSPTFAEAESVPLEAGYQAYTWGVSALFYVFEGMATISTPGSQSTIETFESAALEMLIGQQSIDLLTSTYSGVDLGGETGSISVSFLGKNVTDAVVDVDIITQRTEATYAAWQAKTYAAILQAYQSQLQRYEAAVAEAQALSAGEVGGRNPEANTAIVQAELIKGCIQLLSETQPDGSATVEPNRLGDPELVPEASIEHGEIVRFFQEAFEWDQVVYLFYPYYWAQGSTWVQRSLYEDPDPDFAAFLRAGAARVVFAVRPGYETAVTHYLETGEIWEHGEPPPVSSPTYVAAAQEIAEAEQAAGEETALGEPWEVRLPTTLVRLRSNDSLPEWSEQADGGWVESDPA